MRRASPLFAVAGALAGCVAAPDNSPSLAIRPIEQRGDAVEAPGRPASVPLEPRVLARIAVLDAQIAKAAADFDAIASRAERAAMASGAPGGESWATAQQLLSAAELARGPVTAALVELDSALVEQLNGRSPSTLDELRRAQARAEQVAASQGQAIDRIRARLNR